MPDARFRWPPQAIRFAQEALRRFSGRRHLAAKVSIPPTSVVGFERRLGVTPFWCKLADAREGGFRFLRGVALGPQDGVAVAGLQFQALRSAGGLGFHALVRRERLEQRLSLGDLRKLRRRRKALQRRLENVVGVACAARGLIELGERQRGAQLEAAGLLLLRDGDGGEEGGFSGAGSAEFCLKRISPRMRWRAASNQCSPVFPASVSAASIPTRAASASPPSASISASSPP